jgi:tetratricopeptide (TPR) repeat protein
MNQLACPLPDTLQSLLAATLPSDQETLVSHHVEQCTACQARLDEMTSDPALQSYRNGHLHAVQEAPPTWLVERLAVPEVRNEANDHSLSFLKPGDRPNELGLLGSYRIKRVLGRGGMGVVLHAQDGTLHREVALKVLWPPPGSTEARQRIIKEAQAVASIRHAHVVGVHAVYNEPGDPPYLAMEYVPGQTLREHLKAGDVPLPQIAQWCMEIAEGLQAAHAVGLIHRDIKPTNILIDEDTHRAKLTDFGLARATATDTEPTRQTLLAGTPAYMSPEQISTPERTDVRSDVYGLGATLYEALTGTPPYRGPVEILIRQIVDQEPVAPRRLNLSIPLDLETICLKCLAKAPEQRYATAQLLADDLRRYLDGKPIAARPVGLAGRLTKAIRRRPVLAGVSALLIVSLLAGTAISLTFWHQAERNLALANEKVEAAFRTIDQFCLKVSEDRLLTEAGMQPLRRELLRIAVPELQNLALDKPSDPRLYEKWIKTTYLLAKLKRDIEGPDKALPVLQQVLPVLKERQARTPDDVANRRLLADVLMYEGICRENLRQYDAAHALWKEIQDLLTGHDDPEERLLQSRLNININKTYADQHDLKPAVEYARRGRTIAQQLLQTNPNMLEGRMCLATSTGNLACGLAGQGQPAEAEHLFREAMDHWRKLSQERSDDLLPQMEYLRNVINLCELFLLARRFNEARTELEAGLPLAEKLIRRYPQSLSLRKFHGQFRSYAGLCCHMTGKTAEADEHYQRSVENLAIYHIEDPDDIPIFYDLLRARLLQAYLWQDRYLLTKAAESFEQIVQLLKEYAEKVPAAGVEMTGHRHTVLLSRAMVLSELGKPQEALRIVESVVAEKPYFANISQMVLLYMREIANREDHTESMRKYYKGFLQECKQAERNAPQTAGMYYLAACCAGRALDIYSNDHLLSDSQKESMKDDLHACILRWLNNAKQLGYLQNVERQKALVENTSWKSVHSHRSWKMLVQP